MMDIVISSCKETQTYEDGTVIFASVFGDILHKTVQLEALGELGNRIGIAFFRVFVPTSFMSLPDQEER